MYIVNGIQIAIASMLCVRTGNDVVLMMYRLFMLQHQTTMKGYKECVLPRNGLTLTRIYDMII